MEYGFIMVGLWEHINHDYTPNPEGRSLPTFGLG